MHILVIANHWSKVDKETYAGAFVDRQIASLRQAGVQISTFDLGTSYSPITLLKRWVELRRTLAREDINLVHARYGTLVAIFSVLSGLPTVITYVGSDMLPGAGISLSRTYVGIALSNIAAQFARKIICVSEEIRQALWWQKKHAVVIPDGIDINIFTPGDRIEARQSLGWDPEHSIVMINAARDPVNKGLRFAQEAIEIIRRDVVDAELKVIQGIEPKKMYLCYRAADVLLLASRQEGSPNVVKEALACNLPVVSTPVGDVPERLAGVQPSAIVPRNSGAMAEALTKILKKRERSNGRQFILELSMEKTAQRIIAVYRSALEVA